jgi:dephospho-CoA kinase
MYVIGLTGNIATGKSTVMAVLAELGAEIIDADKVAHELMLPGAPAYVQVLAEFGDGILAPGGAIDRKKLGAIVFRDPARLHRLDEIVHPAVVQHVAAYLPHAKCPVVVMEAIKLIEAGMTALCDEVWVVTSPPELQAARLMQSRGLTRAEAEARISAQPPQSEKARVATVVLDNSGSLADLRRRITDEWTRIQRRETAQA